MEFKYLNDGRKVAVIGQLNNQEAIVQEVFVTAAGDEIPSGERFVAKSLHNEPVLSYQAMQEQRLEKKCKELDTAIKTKNKELYETQIKLQACRNRIASCEKLVKNLPEAELKTFSMFLSGTAEYLVRDGYRLEAPVSFYEATCDVEYGVAELQLLSVFGKSNGDLEYKVNRYRDGSGDWSTCIPCASYDEALAVLKELACAKVENNTLDAKEFELLKTLGIELPSVALERYNERRKVIITSNIEHKKKQLEEVQAAVAAHEYELKSIEGK